jgi:transcriptional regulator with XRE-family HTH domain
LDPELTRIAERVRQWRSDDGLTLQELGERAGVSASTIHKIENSQTVPTISVLLKVAHGLRRPPAELFEGELRSAVVRHVAADDVLVLRPHKGTSVHRLVGGIPRASIDLWRVEHDPGKVVGGDKPMSYTGELIIIIESGALTVIVDGREHTLAPGDTIHFKTDHPHGWENRGDVPVSALFCGTVTKAFGVASEDTT